MTSEKASTAEDSSKQVKQPKEDAKEEKEEEKERKFVDYNNDNKLEYECVKDWPATLNKKTKVYHGFFTRKGGKSTGELSSLNVVFGKETDKSVATENRNRIAKVVTNLVNNSADPCKITDATYDENLRLATVIEAHTSTVEDITEKVLETYDSKTIKAFEFKDGCRDGMVTNCKKVILGIYTADCCPIFFYDSKLDVLGACHSGWKGALNGIIENTVKKMVEKYKCNVNDIECVVGPCLHQKSYEVGPEFIEQFTKEWKDAEKKCFIDGKGDRKMFDILAYVRHRIVDGAKISEKKIQICNINTYDDDRFYSYRRACHQQASKDGKRVKVVFGNFMSFVVMA